MKILALTLCCLTAGATPFVLAEQDTRTLEEQRRSSGAQMEQHREQLDRDINSIRQPGSDATDYPRDDIRGTPRNPTLDDPDTTDPLQRDRRPATPSRPPTTPTPIPPMDGGTGGMGTGTGNGGATPGGPAGGAAAQPQ